MFAGNYLTMYRVRTHCNIATEHVTTFAINKNISENNNHDVDSLSSRDIVLALLLVLLTSGNKSSSRSATLRALVDDFKGEYNSKL